MNLEALYSAVDELSQEARQQLRKYLDQQDQSDSTNARRVLSDLDNAIDAFWGDSSVEEMQAIFEAIRTKSTPSDDVL